MRRFTALLEMVLIFFPKKFLSTDADSSSEKLPRKSRAWFLAKRTDLLPSPLICMRVGGRWSPSYLQESPKLERDAYVSSVSYPARRRENRDQPAAKDSPRHQRHRYSIATLPPMCRCTYIPPLVGRRVPCPTRVDNVSLVGHGTIKRRVTHRTIENLLKPSTATG